MAGYRGSPAAAGDEIHQVNRHPSGKKSNRSGVANLGLYRNRAEPDVALCDVFRELFGKDSDFECTSLLGRRYRVVVQLSTETGDSSPPGDQG